MEDGFNMLALYGAGKNAADSIEKLKKKGISPVCICDADVASRERYTMDYLY